MKLIGTLLAVSVGNVSQTIDGTVATISALEYSDEIVQAAAYVVSNTANPDINSFGGNKEITRTIIDPLTFETAITEDAADHPG